MCRTYRYQNQWGSVHVNIYGHNRVRKIGVDAVKRLRKGDTRKGKRFCEYFLLFSVFNLNVNIVIRNRYISRRQIGLFLIVKRIRVFARKIWAGMNKIMFSISENQSMQLWRGIFFNYTTGSHLFDAATLQENAFKKIKFYQIIIIHQIWRHFILHRFRAGVP